MSHNGFQLLVCLNFLCQTGNFKCRAITLTEFHYFSGDKHFLNHGSSWRTIGIDRLRSISKNCFPAGIKFLDHFVLYGRIVLHFIYQKMSDMSLSFISIQCEMQISQRSHICIFQHTILSHLEHFRFSGPFEKIFIDLKVVISWKHILNFFSQQIFLSGSDCKVILDFHHFQNVIRHGFKSLAYGVTMESFELFPYEFSGNSDILGNFYISRFEIVIFHMEDEFVESGNKLERGFVLYTFDKIRNRFFQ